MNTKIPNLFIVGAPRCGTTSMYSYLKQHPDIFMVPIKEPYYFGTDLLSRIRPSLKKYQSYFRGWNDETFAGEATVLYLYSKQAANELKEYNPSARIIIILRNPVDFLHSYHAKISGPHGYEDIADFEAALEAEPVRRQGRKIPRKTAKIGLETLLYYREVAAFSKQVQRYFDAFGRESVHVIILDDLTADPARVYRDTMRFLELDEDFVPDFNIINRDTQIRFMILLPVIMLASQLASYRNLLSRAFGKFIYRPLLRWNTMKVTRQPMSDQLRERLKSEFAPEVKKLSELLGRDLMHWSR